MVVTTKANHNVLNSFIFLSFPKTSQNRSGEIISRHYHTLITRVINDRVGIGCLKIKRVLIVLCHNPKFPLVVSVHVGVTWPGSQLIGPESKCMRLSCNPPECPSVCSISYLRIHAKSVNYKVGEFTGLDRLKSKWIYTGHVKFNCGSTIRGVCQFILPKLDCSRLPPRVIAEPDINIEITLVMTSSQHWCRVGVHISHGNYLKCFKDPDMVMITALKPPGSWVLTGTRRCDDDLGGLKSCLASLCSQAYRLARDSGNQAYHAGQPVERRSFLIRAHRQGEDHRVRRTAWTLDPAQIGPFS
ncbi:hypothetical protein E3N88_35146 [Mikania micrantha]|uniref:Uncharacterized protein n=1 Tax=Mikania micrantha TaxID=192012 RepID=A0A5N6M133_9ASTR|nr:hypothetical protein E3N88_35146 [Mikania micrantha]